MAPLARKLPRPLPRGAGLGAVGGKDTSYQAYSLSCLPWHKGHSPAPHASQGLP